MLSLLLWGRSCFLLIQNVLNEWMNWEFVFFCFSLLSLIIGNPAISKYQSITLYALIASLWNVVIYCIFFVLLVSTEDENQDALDLSLDSYMDSSMDVVSTDRWSYFNQDVASFHWEGQSSLCHRTTWHRCFGTHWQCTVS